MTSARELTERLKGHWHGSYGKARCPKHPDKNPSLSIRDGKNGEPIVNCHAGCDWRDIKDELRSKGLLDDEKSSFNGKAKSQGYGKFVEAYVYTDEFGNPLTKKERYDPKGQFPQYHYEGGTWKSGLGNAPHVLFRLPELIEAVAQERPVFVVEGEKGANAAVKLGVPATCSGGTNSWRSKFAGHFKDATVIILPDNDEAGRKYADQVARSLTGVAASVKVLALPGLSEHDDLFDWIQAGGTAEKLWQLVETEAVEWKPDAAKPEDWRSHTFTAAALRTMPFPEVSYVVPGLIPEGLTILAGRPKIGKSWAALDVAIGIASKRDVLGALKVDQGDVLYLALEDNPRRLQRRITKLLSPFGGAWPERLTLATRWRRLDQGGVEDIEAWCKCVPEPRLVILDTLAGVRPTRDNSQTLYDTDYKALLDVHRLANDRGLSAVALHHTRKMDADDPLDTVSGSLGLVGCADTCLILARSSKGTTLYVRGRDIEEGERAVIFGNEICRWTLLGDAAEVYRSELKVKNPRSPRQG